jgi:hypothetical protein
MVGCGRWLVVGGGVDVWCGCRWLVVSGGVVVGYGVGMIVGQGNMDIALTLTVCRWLGVIVDGW